MAETGKKKPRWCVDLSSIQSQWNSSSLQPQIPGQYFDAETGKQYNYFRDYDPSIGRYWASHDIPDTSDRCEYDSGSVLRLLGFVEDLVHRTEPMPVLSA